MDTQDYWNFGKPQKGELQHINNKFFLWVKLTFFFFVWEGNNIQECNKKQSRFTKKVSQRFDTINKKEEKNNKTTVAKEGHVQKTTLINIRLLQQKQDKPP